MGLLYLYLLLYCIVLSHCPLLINFGAYLPLFSVSPVYRYVLRMKYIRIRCGLFHSLFFFLN